MHFNYALTDWLLIIHQNCLHKKECFYVGHNWPGNKHYFWYKHLGREKNLSAFNKLYSVTAYLTFSFLKLTIKGFRISTSSLLGQLQHFKVRVGREWTGCVYTVQCTVLYCRCVVLPVRVHQKSPREWPGCVYCTVGVWSSLWGWLSPAVHQKSPGHLYHGPTGNNH